MGREEGRKTQRTFHGNQSPYNHPHHYDRLVHLGTEGQTDRPAKRNGAGSTGCGNAYMIPKAD